MKHLPKNLTVSAFDLWGDTPLHPHVRMASVINHSPMNGMDAAQTANEIAKRYNTQPIMLAALEAVFNWCEEPARDGLSFPLEKVIKAIEQEKNHG